MRQVVRLVARIDETLLWAIAFGSMPERFRSRGVQFVLYTIYGQPDAIAIWPQRAWVWWAVGRVMSMTLF